MKTVVGISGFIGAGKTTAGKHLESLGAFFINADEIVNELYKPERDGYLKIVQFFGDQFLDEQQKIDRVKLSEFVFEDVNKLNIMNKMIHPLVVNETIKIVDTIERGIVLIEAVYFDEDMLGKIVDKIIWVESNKEILLERGIKKGMSEKLLNKIIGAQRKPDNVDIIIENNGTIEEFEMELKKVWNMISKY